MYFYVKLVNIVGFDSYPPFEALQQVLLLCCIILSDFQTITALETLKLKALKYLS